MTATTQEYPAAVVKSLKNQVALVTGASSGIGQAIATALAAHGAAVFLVSRNQSRLDRATKTLRESSPECHLWSCPTDLGNPSDIDRLQRIVERESAQIDILIHSAGLYARGRIREASAAEFDQLYEVNVRGPLLLTKAFLPMLEAQKGQMVFLNSSVGHHAKGDVGLFSSTQHALHALATALRDEVNPAGVRVLEMFLGRTATPRLQALYEQQAKPYEPRLLIQPEDVAAMVVSALNLPRTAEVTDIHMRPLLKSY